MMKRHHLILVGILVVQIVVGVVVFWPKSAATAQREPLFPDLEAEGVVSLIVTNAEGESILLQREDGEWVLPEADNYPADSEKIGSLLNKIASLTSGRLVARTDASYSRLQVSADNFSRRVELETADGREHTLYLGSSPSYGSVHFRIEGESEVYLTNDISAWETEATAASWVDTAYLRVSQSDVTRVTVENDQGTFTFRRDEEGSWTMVGLDEGETLAETRVTATIRQAVSVSMLEPLGQEELSEYGMDDPNAVVTFETEEASYTLRVGAKDPDDGSYVVISSESPYYVRVSEGAVQNLDEYGREDFLEQQTTPTPEEDS